MIEPRKTGAYISRLRKAQNLTQMQLADRLNVTHQAVSRWETGESFPDIATLSQVAELFGVSSDDLLSGSKQPASKSQPPSVTVGAVLEELVEGHPEAVARLAREQPDGMQAFIEAAPVTPPGMLKGVMNHMEDVAFSHEQILALAPFIDQETLMLLMEQDGENLDSRLLAGLAPFLEEGALNRYVDRVIEGTLSWDAVSSMAPFLSGETLDRLVSHIQENGLEGHHLTGLAPFLSPTTLDRLVDHFQEGKIPFAQLVALAPFLNAEKLNDLVEAGPGGTLRPEHLVGLAPFLSSETLDRLVDHFQEGRIPFEQLVGLAPFIESKRLDELVERDAESLIQAGQLAALAPFVSQSVLAGLMDRVMEGSLDQRILAEMAPFFDTEVLSELVRRRINKKSE